MSDPRPAPEAPPRAATSAPPGRRAPLPRAAWALGGGGLVLGLVLGGCSGLGVGALGGVLVAGSDGSLVGGLLGGGERSVAEALPEELPALRAFVAEERGLPWTEEVPVRALDDAEFEVALTDAGDETGAAADEEWPVGLDDPEDGRAETYAALGLTPSATTYRDAWASGDSAVTGFYDTETREVVLRGTGWTPLVAETLVHELVHALDHQHVDLDAPLAADLSPEEVTAHAAVVEGSAERVAWAWFDALDDEQVDAYDLAWDDSWDPGADDGSWEDAVYDPLVDALAQFPYEYGHVAVGAVEEDAGAEGVSALLRDPLTTTEQVLAARPDPSASPGLADAAEVAAPAAPAGAEVLGTGRLGLFVLSLLPRLDVAEDEGYWLEDDVVTFAWAGDAFTTWVDPDDEDRACTAVLVRLDDARGRDDLVEDLGDWVAEAGAVSASLAPVGQTDVELRGCGER
ncbi:hypothetical protein [uncultured Pseudokineococcus sp.]|uniref:hypothetical protein n=1 Tax=uncultured Pseudokineococcus sp. TaxID=1642928 RepID=UPI002615BAD2|nr:hypothetical protein [uncultured Pseudokineococcus sp.]